MMDVQLFVQQVTIIRENFRTNISAKKFHLVSVCLFEPLRFFFPVLMKVVETAAWITCVLKLKKITIYDIKFLNKKMLLYKNISAGRSKSERKKESNQGDTYNTRKFWTHLRGNEQ